MGDGRPGQHAQLVRQAGVPLLPEQAPYSDRTVLYSHDLALLGLQPAPAPPANPCPNLHIRGSLERPELVCYHPGAKGCQCLAQAEKAAKKDGAAAWKELRSATEAAFTQALAAMPLAALRLLARQYGHWEQREQVIGWEAEQCIQVTTSGLIKTFAPYDPQKNLELAQVEMAKLLALAGVRAPWLPPLGEEIAAQLEALQQFVADFSDPGDGLPTPESLARAFQQLDAQGRLLAELPNAREQQGLRASHAALNQRLAALHEQVQASRLQED